MFAIASLSLVLGAQPSHAAVRCVPLSHAGTCDARYATIQAAVDAAAAGDVVLVDAGVYSESVTITGSVTLRGSRAGVDARSRSGAETVLDHPLGPLTIVDCNSDVVVDGFTLSGAVDLAGSWAGIWITSAGCGANGTVRIDNNVIRDNIAGIWVDSGSVTARQNHVRNNTALPGSSEGVVAHAPATALALDHNTFAGHLDSSVSVAGSMSVTIVGNRFDRRIRLVGNSFALIQRNLGVGSGSPDALIDLAGADQRVSVFDNYLVPDATGRAIAVSDTAGTGVASSGFFVNGNCIATAGAVGLSVEAGTYIGMLDATSNWWGSADGPSGIGPGSGAAVVAPAGVVQFAPFRATSDHCGCLGQPDGTPCNDANACTGPDLCVDGTCASSTDACDDGNSCTADSCNPSTGCVHVSVCDDGVPCTIDTCDPVAGCLHMPAAEGAPCSDSNRCTANDHCASGSCIGSPLACDDDNACTVDSCDLAAGCIGAAQNCDDGVNCTIDSCDSASGCVHTNVTCPDPCMSCTAQGACVDLHCDDGVDCTTDRCVAGVGCEHTPNHSMCAIPGAPCIDGICVAGIGCQYVADDSNTCDFGFCYNWHCSQGTCDPGPWPCDDGNPCSTDGCDWNSNSCVHDWCGEGCAICQAGVGCVARDCADSNPCTRDYCIPGAPGQFMCNHDPTAGAECDDGSTCTTSDHCDNLARCVGTQVPAPAEVSPSLRVVGAPAGSEISWDPVAQPGERFDVLRGALRELPVGAANGAEFEVCLLDDADVASTLDSAIPSAGGGFWYVVRKDAACGPGSYGRAETLGIPASDRVSSTCP